MTGSERKEQRRYLDLQVRVQLRRWCSVGVLGYFLFLLLEPWFIPEGERGGRLLIRFAAFVLVAGFTVYCIPRLERFRSAHRVGAGFAYLVAFIACAESLIWKDASLDVAIQLLVCCVCLVLLQPSWVLGSCGGLFALWFGTRWFGPTGPSDGMTGLLVGAAFCIGLTSYWVRYSVVCEQWQRRARELAEQERLNLALEELRGLEGRLEQEMERRSLGLRAAVEDLATAKDREFALHDRLLHANRLQSLGRLSSGLAHRLNNLMTVVQGGLDCLDGERLDEQEKLLAADLHEAVLQGASLTSKLLSLTARQNLTLIRSSVEDLLVQKAALFKHVLLHEPSVQVASEAREAIVSIDREAWFQIVANLLRNAEQSMDGARAGELVISLAEERVWFSVLDRGPGIPPEMRTRIFEPFFTTRQNSGGTGLGLAIVLGLTEQLKGRLDYAHRDGGGSAFTVSFPLERAQP